MRQFHDYSTIFIHSYITGHIYITKYNNIKCVWKMAMPLNLTQVKRIYIVYKTMSIAVGLDK